jgi:hypothetical protein
MGDGPIWSVTQAWRRGVKVTYLVNERDPEPVQQRLAITNMNWFINVVVVGDA